MFDLARFPAVLEGKGKERAWGQRELDEYDGGDEGEDAAGAGVDTGGGDQTKINWVNVDEQLRAAVRRLAYASEKIAPLPEGCTFTVAVELRDEAEAPIGVSASFFFFPS